MKKGLYLLLFVLLWGCKGEVSSYPIYKVDLDQPKEILSTDLFTSVKVIPLQTTEKSHFNRGELGVKEGRYLILDREQQLFFCFDTTGKFKYVLDNKPKKKYTNPKQRSILNPYSYYYNKKWYYYLTFRNVVYTVDQKGNKQIAYLWDFGEYNDDKDIKLNFPPFPLQILVPIQQAWMKANSAFALTNARQSKDYIYTLVERIDSTLSDNQRFYHLLCYKPTGDCYYFNVLSNEIPLGRQVRLENNCMLMLVSWWEKERYEDLELLDENSRQVLQRMKNTDNPVLLKWYLK